jgi:zinc and cadmium transporter
MEALIAAVVISVLSLSGIILVNLKPGILSRITTLLVALAAGGFLGNAFLHLLPEAWHMAEEVEGALFGESTVPIFVLAGIVCFFLLEKFLHWHHHNLPEDKKAGHIHPIAVNNLVGDGLHNFLDGIALAAAFSISGEVGIAAALAIALHEIPQEVGDFAILVKYGMSRTKALFWNLVSALLAVVGVFSYGFLQEQIEGFEYMALAFVGGVFIYIATSDLFPGLQEIKGLKKNVLVVGAFMLGLIFMYLITGLESAH